MAFFTRRDRIAVTVISLLILAGWGVRYCIFRSHGEGEIRILRNAVETPSGLLSPEEIPPLLIDINTADGKTLESLPMIGPVKARRIIEYREENGPFGEISEITRVPGIGPATFRAIKDRITVSPVKGTGNAPGGG